MEEKPRHGCWILTSLFLYLVGFSSQSLAGPVDFSFGFGYSKKSYGGNSYAFSRRYSVSLSFSLSQWSEIELGFQDVHDRNNIENYEDTEFHDRIYSALWVQNLLGQMFRIQPFVKGGVGQLNRDANGFYANGTHPPSQLDSVTGILGAGVKIYFSQNMAIKFEGTSYLTGGRIETWRDNVGATAGISIRF